RGGDDHGLSAPPGNVLRLLERDHTSRWGVLSRARSHHYERSLRPSIARCSRPRSSPTSPGGALVPAVGEVGVQPIPAELRTAGWRGLFAINFTFFLNPVMYLLGAFAVVDGGLPLWWAVAAMTVGQALAYAALVIVAQPGVDYGLPGQVAMRATLGFWGARLLSSPYRVVAATYWFAAQALTGGLGIQALVKAMPGHHHVPLVPTALALAAFHALLAIAGFDVMRWLLRVVLPVSLAFTAILIGLYVAS